MRRLSLSSLILLIASALVSVQISAFAHAAEHAFLDHSHHAHAHHDHDHVHEHEDHQDQNGRLCEFDTMAKAASGMLAPPQPPFITRLGFEWWGLCVEPADATRTSAHLRPPPRGPPVT